eukprot:NODE_517_length_6557_cov_0.431558.p1 type:complete len:655 gc:universal NODE_517_length_6557_cov_0.431558:5628-3664(-)
MRVNIFVASLEGLDSSETVKLFFEMPRHVSLLTTEIVEARIKEKQNMVYCALSGTFGNYDVQNWYSTISTPYQYQAEKVVQPGSVYWASKYEYEHDTIRGAFPEYLEIKMNNVGRKDVILGKTIIPRIFLTQEQICGRSWFPCSLTEPVSGYGSIRFSILYSVEKKSLELRIIECKKLTCTIPSMKPCPYVIATVLPDPKGINIKRTPIVQNSENPKFNEIMMIQDDKLDREMEVAIFVFGQIQGDIEFHGHVRVPISIIHPNIIFERELPLSPITQQERKTRSSINSTNIDNKYTASQEKMILKKFHSTDYNNGKTHKWQGTFAPTATACIFCLGLIPKNSDIKTCSECHGTVHKVCSKYCVNSCGCHQLLQLNFFKEDIQVYKYENYMKFMDNLMKQEYLLVNLVEKNREECSKALIKVCDSLNCIHELLYHLLKYEINKSESLGTLFRNNSMCSKTVECYFKYQGMQYLKDCLKEPINDFLKSELDGELDPTRLELPAEQSPKNLTNLMSFCDKLITSIFSKVADFPKPLQTILFDCSNHVLSRFSDPNALYPAVAGFVFLRFFAPAILGPNLFELTNQFIDEKRKRTLTLAAKTIQNLANLTLFGSISHLFRKRTLYDSNESMGRTQNQTNDGLFREFSHSSIIKRECIW